VCGTPLVIHAAARTLFCGKRLHFQAIEIDAEETKLLAKIIACEGFS
jgi:hypothetical protein